MTDPTHYGIRNKHGDYVALLPTREAAESFEGGLWEGDEIHEFYSSDLVASLRLQLEAMTREKEVGDRRTALYRRATTAESQLAAARAALREALTERDYRIIHAQARKAKMAYFKEYVLCDIPMEADFSYWVMKETMIYIAARTALSQSTDPIRETAEKCCPRCEGAALTWSVAVATVGF